MPALAAILLAAAPAAAGAQASVSLVGGGLAFGTVLPGTAPVVIAPWTSAGGRGRTASTTDRSAPVFQITGAPGATVRIRFPSLPARIDNGSGAGSLAVGGWTAQFNTVNGPSGAVAFTPSATPATFTLGTSGRGYVSLGATVQAAASQPKGAYALAGGGAIEVQ